MSTLPIQPEPQADLQAMTPPESQVDQQILTLPERARAIAIINQETYDTAVVMLGYVVARRKKIVEEFAPRKQKAFAAHQALCAWEKEHLKHFEEAEGILKRGLAAFEAKQRQIEDERRRAEEEKERRRQEEELEAAAEQAEKQGAAPEEVAAILTQPMIQAPVPVQQTYVRASGVSTLRTYKAEVVDIRKLARAVADGVVAANLIEANMPALNAMARASKGAMQIPGVSFKEEMGVRYGGRR